VCMDILWFIYLSLSVLEIPESSPEEAMNKAYLEMFGFFT